MEFETAFLESSKKILLLGSSGLLKLIGLKAHELGLEVVNISSYDLSPASQVAHRKYICNLSDEDSLLSLIKRENPDAIITDLDEVSPKIIESIENEGFKIFPNTTSIKYIVDKKLIRSLAAKSTTIKIPRFVVSDNINDIIEACKSFGYPCIIKPNTPGMMEPYIVNNEEELKDLAEKSVVKTLIAEEYLNPQKEVAVFFFNYLYNGLNTLVLNPIEYQRKGEYFMEAWQPAEIPEDISKTIIETTILIGKNIGTLGGFFATYFIDQNNNVYINDVNYALSELAIVTLASCTCSVFGLMLRLSLGLPLSTSKTFSAAAMHLLISTINKWSPTYVNIDRIYSVENARLILFGEPKVKDGKVIGAVIANDEIPKKAREKARIASSMFLIL